MVQSLADYVKKEVAQGYSVEQIRAALIKYGYPEHQIDTAIKQYTQQINSKGKVEKTTKIKPKAKLELNINYKKIGLILGSIIILVIIILLINNSLKNKTSSEKESELLLSIEPIQTTIQSGQDVSFIKRISFSGKAKISFSYSLLDKNNNIILTDYETIDIINSITSRTEIKTSSNIEPGQYTLRIIGKYNNKEIIKLIEIKVFEESETPSCFDNIQNQGEEGIDCGGPCLPCEKCPISCDDNNPCTEDYCSKNTNYECVNEEIVGCGETTFQRQEQPAPLGRGEEKSMYEIRKELYETIKTDSEQAIVLCKSITADVEKDLCIKSVAELTNSSKYCSQIIKPLTRDSCYMKFVINNNEFQHCSLIQDKYLKDSCTALEKINQQ